jgi:Subunit ChlI of Mg-chelatase
VSKRKRIKPVSTVLSRAPLGLAAPLIRVEVHLGSGLPAFAMVGLPEAVVRESQERVRSALMTSGFEFPAARITVNLSPADLPKKGCKDIQNQYPLRPMSDGGFLRETSGRQCDGQG